jgi:RecB family exonuclease
MQGNNGEKHLSHSQISMLLRCPRQYCYRYIEGIRVPPGAALLLGTSYHAALEHNFKQKVQTGEDLGVDVILDAYESAWTKKLANEEIDWQGESPSETKDMGARLVDVYMQNAAPFVMPVEVERKFSVHLPGLDGYTLDGIIDLIDDKGVIIDHKTASKSKTQTDADNDLQPYAYAAAQMEDPAIDEVPFQYQVAVKKKKPDVQLVDTVRNRQQVGWYLQLCSDVVRQIKAAIFPCNPCGWHCDPKWCGYYEMCKGGKR